MENSYLEIINKNKQIEIANIKECNLFTQEYGLVLSDTQIKSLIEKRKEALKNTGRVELRGGILDKLIKAFCDSPYIDQENYASTLYELVDIFYEYKNESMDLVTDEELIKFMKKSFNGICKGSTNYLAGTVMDKMKKDLLQGKTLQQIKEGEDFE